MIGNSISVTTRKPREGEMIKELFLYPEEFMEMVERMFIEHAEVYGNYYGTPRKFVEENIGKGRAYF